MPLPTDLALGAVHLAVADVDGVLPLYRDVLGLQVAVRDDGAVALGAGGDDLLVLHAAADAAPATRHAGLYHVCLRYPRRADLGAAAAALAAAGVRPWRAMAYGTHDAIYLDDAAGNGLELAWDRPRAEWPPDGAPLPDGPPPALDLEALAASGPAGERAPAGLDVGHVHLHVGDVDAGVRFYCDDLGFELAVARLPDTAFVAVGGYHHHVAFNVWEDAGPAPAPGPRRGLVRWTLRLDRGAVEALAARLAAAGRPLERGADGSVATRDPWGTPLVAEPRP